MDSLAVTNIDDIYLKPYIQYYHSFLYYLLSLQPLLLKNQKVLSWSKHKFTSSVLPTDMTLYNGTGLKQIVILENLIPLQIANLTVIFQQKARKFVSQIYHSNKFTIGNTNTKICSRRMNNIQKQYHYIEVQVWDDECVRT